VIHEFIIGGPTKRYAIKMPLDMTLYAIKGFFEHEQGLSITKS
jgi:hypothetical protein